MNAEPKTIAGPRTNENIQVPHTSIRRVEADGVNVFYREAGAPEAPVVLLLHGFPASSFTYRELIPRLADRYRVIAPDLPGFGFTEVPALRKYPYSFDALAGTILAFTDALQLKRYALYVFDYGAPTGLRLALAHPERIMAIVAQNGNARRFSIVADLRDTSQVMLRLAPVNRFDDPDRQSPSGIRVITATSAEQQQQSNN